ncbi:hypothetical protein N8198_08790, partial [Gammaproteobacteria bacterium]|nr:hypothetical protein [Gammaproteobacteria bacterium]
GGIQDPDGVEKTGGWGWVTKEEFTYTNWGPLEPNNSPNSTCPDPDEDVMRFIGVAQWNDAPGCYDYGAGAGYVVEYEEVTQTVVLPGPNQLIFNEAGKENSPNPLTAAYQEVIAGGDVSINCCRVLDTREGAGSDGTFSYSNFDIGLALDDISTNPSCAAIPDQAVPQGSAILQAWHRAVPRSRGLVNGVPTDTNGGDLREYDIGVCLIESDVESKGVVFQAEETFNVLGYSVDCTEDKIPYRPFTAGVGIDPVEVDAPYATRWSAECDGSRSAKRYSSNVMLLNIWHDKEAKNPKPYLSEMADALLASIASVSGESCVDNSGGFLDDLAAQVASAKRDILRGKKQAYRAEATLDEATKLALLVGDNAPSGDPYEPGECLINPNPKGLFVGRLMALKFGVCSELLHKNEPSDSSINGNCLIDPEILAELPELP